MALQTVFLSFIIKIAYCKWHIFKQVKVYNVQAKKVSGLVIASYISFIKDKYLILF